MYFNSLQNVTGTLFNNLTNIEFINLCANNLTRIYRNTFQNLKKLTYFHICKNNITLIEDGAFNNLPRLSIIRANDCKLDYSSGGLISKWCKDCPKLYYVDYKQCYLYCLTIKLVICILEMSWLY